jgi:hypothetical protein
MESARAQRRSPESRMSGSLRSGFRVLAALLCACALGMAASLGVARESPAQEVPTTDTVTTVPVDDPQPPPTTAAPAPDPKPAPRVQRARRPATPPAAVRRATQPPPAPVARRSSVVAPLQGTQRTVRREVRSSAKPASRVKARPRSVNRRKTQRTPTPATAASVRQTARIDVVRPVSATAAASAPVVLADARRSDQPFGRWLLLGMLVSSALLIGAAAVPAGSLEFSAAGRLLADHRGDLGWLGAAVLAITGCMVLLVTMTAP